MTQEGHFSCLRRAASVGPRRSIRADVSTDEERLARTGATIAPIVAVAIAAAINFRITATYPIGKDSPREEQSPRPIELPGR